MCLMTFALHFQNNASDLPLCEGGAMGTRTDPLLAKIVAKDAEVTPDSRADA